MIDLDGVARICFEEAVADYIFSLISKKRGQQFFRKIIRTISWKGQRKDPWPTAIVSEYCAKKTNTHTEVLEPRPYVKKIQGQVSTLL